MLRPAAPTASVRVQVQFRSRGGSKWQRRKTITVGGPRHYFETRVDIPASGFVRLSWRNGAKPLTSRAAAVLLCWRARREWGGG